MFPGRSARREPRLLHDLAGPSRPVPLEFEQKATYLFLPRMLNAVDFVEAGPGQRANAYNNVCHRLRRVLRRRKLENACERCNDLRKTVIEMVHAKVPRRDVQEALMVLKQLREEKTALQAGAR